MIDFLRENWAVIALGASELLAFVPAKWNGIAQSAIKVLTAVFGKKKV